MAHRSRWWLSLLPSGQATKLTVPDADMAGLRGPCSEAEVEMSKAVNLTGGVTDIRRREPGETGLSHGTQRVGPVDIEIGGSTVAHQEGNPVGGLAR